MRPPELATGKIINVQNNQRPVYLNLFRIRLPVTGMVSLAHRATGIVLFIAIPFVAYLLDLSVRSPQGFGQVRQWLSMPALQLVQILVLWAFAHHFFAGIRFLLIDADIGVDKARSRLGAWLVIVAELMTLVLIIAGVTR